MFIIHKEKILRKFIFVIEYFSYFHLYLHLIISFLSSTFQKMKYLNLFVIRKYFLYSWNEYTAFV